MKTPSYQYRISHYRDKTVSWPSDLNNGNSYIGKTAFFFTETGNWDRLNMKKSSYQYMDPHVKDKTVSWPSYLEYGNLIPRKTVFILKSGTGLSGFRIFLLVRDFEISADGRLTARSREVSKPHEIGCYNDRIALASDKHLDSAAAEVPVRFQSDWKSLNPNLAATRPHEILW